MQALAYDHQAKLVIPSDSHSTGCGCCCTVPASRGHLGNTLLYKLMQTLSLCCTGPSKRALKAPCVPSGSVILPLLPDLVQSSTGLNHRMSSGLKNISRTTALVLCTLTGYPDKTIFLMMRRSGSTERSAPVAANWGTWPGVTCRRTTMEHGSG